MYQSQLESERLLTEFRAQKKENEQLREDRNKLLQQQAETEKLAARLHSQLNSNRSPSARGSQGIAERSLPHTLNNNLRSRTVGATNPSRLDGTTRDSKGLDREQDATRSALNPDSLQWRPIRKATR